MDLRKYFCFRSCLLASVVLIALGLSSSALERQPNSDYRARRMALG